MLALVRDAFHQIFSPLFRATFYKVLGLTLVLLALGWAGLEYAAVHSTALQSLSVQWPWLATALNVALGVGMIFGMAFLVAPISSLVASLFLDDLAEAAESEIYPPGVGGRAAPLGQSLWLGLKFFLVSSLVNLAALALFLIPGVNAIVFFIANAYLLGREYFELAALRFDPIQDVRKLRSDHGVFLFLCGLLIATFVAVPILNLVTPLFGVALMARVRKKLADLATPQASNERITIQREK